MDDRRSISMTSSNAKRKRAPPAYYAVQAGHKPAVYFSWDDAKEQTRGFKDPVVKRFGTLADAEAFVKNASPSPVKPGKAKYYGVQAGHTPGVYTDYNEVKKQVTGFKGGKQRSFTTWEEALAFVNEGKGAISSDNSAPISLKGHLGSMTPSVDEPRKGSKKQKKNDGSAAVPETNGYYEPGTGPLPPGTEDGFDRTVELHPIKGLVPKNEEVLEARKTQPTGDFEGPLHIWTDGAAKNNGQIGAVAGIGVWFGPIDPRNVSDSLFGNGRQTNQRAELAAIARAIDICPIDRSAVIYSDSHYSIQCLTVWFQKWETNQWKNSAGKPVENRDLIEPILARLRERGMAKVHTKFEWVKGHANNAGNIGADRLATQGALKGQVEAQRQKANGVTGAHALAREGVEDGEAQRQAAFYSPLGSPLEYEEAT